MLKHVGRSFLSILSREANEFISTNILEIGKDDVDEIKPESIERYMEQNGIYACMLFCQYCNEVSFFKGTTPIYERVWSCPGCHESEMTYKGLNNKFFSFFLQDIKNLLDENREYLINKHHPMVLESGRYVQLLYFQMVVNMATELEVFFRNVYGTWMNNKYIKENNNLFSKFYKESKNIFINFEKINEVFRKELNVNLKELLEEEIVNDIKTLFIKRHVIVHNSGIIDSQYKSSISDDYNIGDVLVFTDKEIGRYKHSTNHIKALINIQYLSEIQRTFIDRINNYFTNDYPNPIISTIKIPKIEDTIYRLNFIRG